MEFQALESPKEGGKKQFVAQVMAAEPVPPEIGLVDLNTVVFVDWDSTPEFSKIHFGVQFKVVCCEPRGPARIGKNTTIFCEGVLHPSLRNLLPPEMIEQLQALPPGLQMMLLNTEAVAEWLP
eukprot:g2854.t1